jgi:hypothetical protein
MFRTLLIKLSVYGVLFLLAGCAPLRSTAPLPARPVGYQYPHWVYYNPISPADTERRNLDRAFRAGRLNPEEYRERKRALQMEYP